MAQVIHKPLEVDAESTQSSSSADSGDANHPLIDVPEAQEPEKKEEASSSDSGPESDENSSEVEDKTIPHRNGNVSSTLNSSGGAGERSETPPLATPVSEPIGPEDALEEIRRQETHYLYCSICKSNITTNAKLYKKDTDPYPYNTKPYVLWFPSINLSWFSRNFKDLTLPSPRFLLAVVLLVLSITLMRFHHSPVTPSGPPSHVTPPSGPPSHVPPPPGPPPPVPQPGPVSPPLSPGLDPYIKIGWLIHFKSSNYLSIFWLLFLAILALLWPYIPLSINFVIGWGKALVTPAPAPSLTQPEPQPPVQPEPQPPVQPEPQPRVQPQPQPPVQPEPRVRPRFHIIRGVTLPISIFMEVLPLRIAIVTELVERHIVVPVRNLDILKSIVYGGLIESITSLGVVSSAAASGASTLNVLALGLANLFSGLFLIIHSLYGLISNQRFQNANNDDHMTSAEADDPYVTLLGNRRKVKLHFVVVVLSFIIFGVIPPLFYGLSFKRTDKGHYKAAVVLAASLVCVISLSFAKAYAFGLRKLRTVGEYTGMAIGASALSFIVSQIVSDMLEKYGFHELASDYRKG